MGRGADGRGRSCTVTRRRTPDHSAVMCTNSSACRPECLMLFPTSSETSNLASSNSSEGIARALRDRRTSARDSGLARTLRSSRHLSPASEEPPFALTNMVYPLDEPSTPIGISSSARRAGPRVSRRWRTQRCSRGPWTEPTVACHADGYGRPLSGTEGLCHRPGPTPALQLNPDPRANGNLTEDGRPHATGSRPRWWWFSPLGVLLAARSVAVVLILVVIALVLAVGLEPLVQQLTRRGLTRGWAASWSWSRFRCSCSLPCWPPRSCSR